MTRVDCLRILELGPAAGHEEVHAAFRRLAKRYHPDVSRGRHDHRPFAHIVRAYLALQHEKRLRDHGYRVEICSSCGRPRELLQGLNGQAWCGDCLLGAKARWYLLPLPTIKIVRCTAVVGLQIAAISLLIHAVSTGSVVAAVSSVAVVTGSMILLAVHCLSADSIA